MVDIEVENRHLSIVAIENADGEIVISIDGTGFNHIERIGIAEEAKQRMISSNLENARREKQNDTKTV